MTLQEAIKKMTELTGQNLKLLQDINKSFTSDKSHIISQIGGVDFHIPSFIHLENKINHLQWAFENLVKSPQHGEAWFNFDGNSRAIEVRGYQQSPARISHTPIDFFETLPYNGFKDLMTPQPVIKMDCSSLPDDIRHVNVRKIVFYDNRGSMELPLSTTGASKVVSYKHIKSIVENPQNHNKFYIYDSVYELPLKTSAGTGQYIIKELVSESLEPEQHVELKVHSSLTYINSLYNEVPLQIGDKLTTWDGSCRMEIVGMDRSDNTLNLKINSGEYTNFIPHKEGEISDYSKLRFYEPIDFKKDKYINIPLEEDQYVYICISPVNSRLGTQSLWSDGLMIDTSLLTNAKGQPFRKYYDENVKNIGDTFQELIAIAPSAITKFSPVDYKTIVDTEVHHHNIHYSVHHTNFHMTDSETIKSVEAVNKTISTLKDQLAESQVQLSVAKTAYEADDPRQPDKLQTVREKELIVKQQTDELQEQIDKLEVLLRHPNLPLDTPEYHILAWVDLEKSFPDTVSGLSLDEISHIEYRYARKRPGMAIEPIETILPIPFTHTKWEYGQCYPNEIGIEYDAGSYKVTFDKSTPQGSDKKNNSFKIPIRPGEEISWQVRIVWRFGQPYTHVKGKWCETINTSFPATLLPTLNPLQLVQMSFDNLILSKLTTMMVEGTDTIRTKIRAINDEIQKIDASQTRLRQLEQLIESTKDGVTQTNSDYENLKAKVDTFLNGIHQIPKVSVDGKVVGPSETVSETINLRNKKTVRVTIRDCKLFSHSHKDMMLVDGEAQKSSGLIYLDKVYGEKLMDGVHFKPKQFAMPDQKQTIKFIDIDVLTVEIPLGDKIGTGEIALSLKYDPAKEPLIYIIKVTTNDR